MRNIILFLVLIITFNCNAQIVNFGSGWIKANILSTNTTTNLRAKDLNGNWLKIDQNDDGEIQVSEALNVSYYFDANALYVSSYEGINSFQNLETLIFAYNQTPVSLDLSGLNNLKKLNCYFNNLTSINFNGCNSLEEIYLDQNYLTTIDLSEISTLKYLDCQNNDLTSLVLPTSSILINLKCFNNNLNNLVLTNQTHLENLYCGNNFLTNLNLSNCINLKLLQCYRNNLNNLDISNSPLLNNIFCSYNPNLKYLNINNGFNWLPNTNYAGNNLSSNIIQLCTSSSSVVNLQNYYNSLGYSSTSFISNCSTLGINSNEITNLKNIFYPNPAQDEIVFSGIVNSVIIYDLNGRLIKSSSINRTTMEISDIKQGLYIINIESEDGFFSSKLIIE
jgi:hypothetical protein